MLLTSMEDVMRSIEPKRFAATRCLLAAASMLAVFSASPAHAQAPYGCDPSPAAVQDIRLRYGEPQNIDLLKKELLYYRCNSYEADVRKVADAARVWIEQRAPQVKNPALVLDIDETSLSNWERILRDDFGYIPNGACELKRGEACGDNKWQELKKAPALQPTLDLHKAVKDKVTVFFVTGRSVGAPGHENARQWTSENLREAGYLDWPAEHLYLRDEKRPGETEPKPYPNVTAYKTASRRDIEKQGFTIIANIGDQDSDLRGDQDGDHAERTFKLPNPFYYIP